MQIIDLNLARSELAASEARTRALRQIVDQLQTIQTRFDKLNGSPDSVRLGLTENVRDIFQAAPAETFTTRQVLARLKNLGFDTSRRHVGSSLSTTLTRLGQQGFITITTDGETRTYRLKTPTAPDTA